MGTTSLQPLYEIQAATPSRTVVQDDCELGQVQALAGLSSSLRSGAEWKNTADVFNAKTVPFMLPQDMPVYLAQKAQVFCSQKESPRIRTKPTSCSSLIHHLGELK
jgi:hypothetical protein